MEILELNTLEIKDKSQWMHLTSKWKKEERISELEDKEIYIPQSE